MAVIDEEQGHLVVRVVYDGPPLSGKTTSLRTLAQGLGAEVHTPEEHEGRTLFFDWVDYVGGMFEGRQIHCQILSVPGQLELAPRRHALLRSADVVVLVADTRVSEFPAATALLELTARWCRDQTPPVGMVFQANKRDAPDAVSEEVLRETVRAIAPIAVIESIATEGDGVRESFVFAVRLALDRVRALAGAGVLGETREVESARQVETQLAGLEVNSIGNEPRIEGAVVKPPLSVVAGESPTSDTSDSDTSDSDTSGSDTSTDAATVPTLRENARESRPRISLSRPRDERAFRPDPHMPGGLIWPPVDGRALLHEVAAHSLQPRRSAEGAWVADVGSWRCRSGKGQRYHGLERGREALIRSARLHVNSEGELSAGRIVVLADAGADHYRLWQLYRAVPTLEDTLAALRPDDAPSELVDAFVHAGRGLRSALERFRVHPLPCRLDTVSAECGRFAGVLDEAVVANAATPDADALVRQELFLRFQRYCETRSETGRDVTAIRAMMQAAASRNEPTALMLLEAIR